MIRKKKRIIKKLENSYPVEGEKLKAVRLRELYFSQNDVVGKMLMLNISFENLDFGNFHSAIFMMSEIL